MSSLLYIQKWGDGILRHFLQSKLFLIALFLYFKTCPFSFIQEMAFGIYTFIWLCRKLGSIYNENNKQKYPFCSYSFYWNIVTKLDPLFTQVLLREWLFLDMHLFSWIINLEDKQLWSVMDHFLCLLYSK